MKGKPLNVSKSWARSVVSVKGWLMCSAAILYDRDVGFVTGPKCGPGSPVMKAARILGEVLVKPR